MSQRLIVTRVFLALSLGGDLWAGTIPALMARAGAAALLQR